MKIVLTDFSLICPLGMSPEEILENAVSNPLIGMKVLHNFIPSKDTVFGSVDKELSGDDIRSNLLLKKILPLLNIERIKSEYDPKRIGIVLGLTNTGIHESQIYINEWLDTSHKPKDFKLEYLNLNTPCSYLKKTLDIQGPCFSISTACSSSSKAFQSARALLLNDICDCVIVGGVDSYCNFVLTGFSSLEVLSNKQTNPMSKNRKGINLGEGACLFIMEKDKQGIEVKGIGESSDAYHITAPDPNGIGAELSMRKALEDSKLEASDIDYINLHGTGTIHNDLMEAQAIYNIFSDSVPCSSTKPMTGHLLGTSGAMELALCCLMIQHSCIFPHIYDGEFDEAIKPIQLVNRFESKKIKNVLSNAFGFSGSNASIIIGI